MLDVKIFKPFVPSLRKKKITENQKQMQAVYFDDIYAYATNAHIAVRVKHRMSVSEPYIHDFKDNEEYVDFNYPNIQSIFERNDNRTDYTTIRINSKEFKKLKEVHERGMILDKEAISLDLETNIFTTNNATARKDNNILQEASFKETYPLNVEGDKMKICYNPKHFINALQLFKKLKKDNVEITMKGRFDPIIMKSEDVTVLIMPRRTY